MKITSIRIEKLFDIFNYSISFRNNENILIITGPNGFGKTMVLNIIFNLFNKNFSFFESLVFERVGVWLDDYTLISITKIKDSKSVKIRFEVTQYGQVVATMNYPSKVQKEFVSSLHRYLPVSRIDEDKWIDLRTDKTLNITEIINEFGDQLPPEILDSVGLYKSNEINKYLDALNVHLIKEQRLFKKVKNNDRNPRYEKDHSLMIETIQTYAKELKQLISYYSQESFVISQRLDSSYPDRLIKEKNKLSEADYLYRFASLKETQEKLAKYGLYERKQQMLRYSPEDAKALLVYINDFEQKLGVFDDLLEKLELFTGILNDRRFTFKTIEVDKEKGFYFKPHKGKELELSQLSSGEQHEVVLLYELIFNARPGVLVLIDEPEISLHITWQKQFLNDLLRIIRIQRFQVIVATHSPSVINDRWDLVYNLESTF
ncbi:AAA family ATPase [Dyadobacter psychrophilus]|uniref:Predicted ATP-binding protein involved in virulence n=1 Tax=Dyadobacter psychrophilus TaxID=651661 RepID=A0A1T5ETW9_9BACT|nr:AAA family ATPase [Dyadobacter psychrophilus]SKB87239.1 Predicted ATP-binding protein involved in virulence [Dyadobacter psychrophilus]